jgi:hypothetical protein
MPAPVCLFGLLPIGKHSTLGLVVQNQSGEKEAFCKKENANNMNNSAQVSMNLNTWHGVLVRKPEKEDAEKNMRNLESDNLLAIPAFCGCCWPCYCRRTIVGALSLWARVNLCGHSPPN